MLKGDLNSAIETNMQEGMKNYGAPDHNGVDATWDTVQRELKCCGVNEWQEWKAIDTAGKPKDQVPESCCINEQEGCGKNPTDETVYGKGCYDTFSDGFTDNLNYVGGKTTLHLSLSHISALMTPCFSLF